MPNIKSLKYIKMICFSTSLCPIVNIDASDPGQSRNVLRIDIEFRQDRGAAEAAEVSVDRLARVAHARVSSERARDPHRGSIDIHVRDERRSTFQ
jgi:hypothetical protein